MALHRCWLRALGLWRLFFKALCQTPSHPDFLYRSLVRVGQMAVAFGEVAVVPHDSTEPFDRTSLDPESGLPEMQAKKRRWMGRGGYPGHPGHLAESKCQLGENGTHRVAVLGRTLSSLLFVKELQRALKTRTDIVVEIALFPAMFDPARNIYTPHAMCEFTSSNFLATAGDQGDNAELCALEDDFAERYLRPWLKHGCVRESHDSKPAQGSPVSYSVMNGGMFQLLKDLEQELVEDSTPCGNISVSCHEGLQLTQMWYDEISKKWCLYSEFVKGSGKDWYSAHQVPNASTFYDNVIMGFDLDPRGARKASFKQMLESALPTTGSVIRCLASAPCASAMSCVVEFEGEGSDGSELSTLEDAGILELAEQLKASSHAIGRGLRFQGRAVWNLTATVKWSKSIRSSFAGSWDKKKVENEMVDAFRRARKASDQLGRHKGLVPCFHWQNAWPLTALSDFKKPSCVYDARCKLGYASDAFVFFPVSAATALRQVRACNLLHPFKSARDLAALVAQDLEGTPSELSRLPHRSEWKFRSELVANLSQSLREAYSDTGRADPQDGLDHTWPTAAQLASDESLVLHHADSLKKYRNR
ncbi:hypothetical protein AK812_SmicGene39053 [Symbiodinium microadriaticum]|uniref:Uncharacterized protein n=1 Tax=Symbiodinium microadriaticum TaxID=2951 RepID=A0A1Q9CC68_SYMMI|nr:hypothetical protein AK812_SmicGene39053 [Symbiodinium microadriaticum]